MRTLLYVPTFFTSSSSQLLSDLDSATRCSRSSPVRSPAACCIIAALKLEPQTDRLFFRAPKASMAVNESISLLVTRSSLGPSNRSKCA